MLFFGLPLRNGNLTILNQGPFNFKSPLISILKEHIVLSLSISHYSMGAISCMNKVGIITLLQWFSAVSPQCILYFVFCILQKYKSSINICMNKVGMIILLQRLSAPQCPPSVLRC